jgi:hypothetical protein
MTFLALTAGGSDVREFANAFARSLVALRGSHPITHTIRSANIKVSFNHFFLEID